jgi:serine/threonine protein kinase
MSILNTEPDPLPKICSPDMNDLVTKLLTKNHNDRPDVPTIFKIPFVKGMLKKLRDKKLSKPQFIENTKFVNHEKLADNLETTVVVSD